MRKIRKICILMMLCCVLVGCGEEINPVQTEEQSSENQEAGKVGMEEIVDFSQLKNGDKVSIQINEDVLLDAKIQIPEEGMDNIEICHVQTWGYEGEEYAPMFNLDKPLEEWESSKGDGGYCPEMNYIYDGEIHVGDTMMDGMIWLGYNLLLRTEHWNDCDDYFYTYTYGPNGQRIAFDGYHIDGELPFMTKEEAKAAGNDYLEETFKLERAEPLQIYSYSHEGMEQYQKELYNDPTVEITGKPYEIKITDWSRDDDCYLIEYEQYYKGLPLLSNNVERKDDVAIPQGTIVIGCTENGVEYVYLDPNYILLERKKTELASLDRICEELKRKFDMAITSDLTLDEMKLIYFPFPTATDPAKPYEYDLLPVWQFSFYQGNYREYVYINAADGNELSF